MNPEIEPEITEEIAQFYESQTQRMFDYAIESYDRALDRGGTILQWYFGVISGGAGISATLFKDKYHCLAFGFAVTVAAASHATINLLATLRSRATQPPGNLASNLHCLLKETSPRRRWLAALGMDSRISHNLQIGTELWREVNKARMRFAALPAWLIGGTVIACAAKFCFSD